MSRNKHPARKLRLAKAASQRTAPRWADIKAFGLKRARARRLPSQHRNWRRDGMKV